MSKGSPEDIKLASHGLRGTIAQALADPAITHLDDSDNVLLKHHGSYQQDDRDLRAQLSKEKKEKAWSFMVRSKMPGGRVTAAQWLIHDKICTTAAGTIRLTTRQGIQLHGILKGELKNLIASVNRSGLTTIGACGDVVRNIMGPASPIKDFVHEDSQKLAEEISRRTLWRSSGYSEIWLDGEKIELLSECNLPDGAEDPLYGKVWLPRKFKMGISIAPRNDVDIFSQDIGFVPHVADGAVEGYSIFIGGGFGMSHGQLSTRPFLAQPLGYVKRANVVDVALAVVTTQRDHGNREERKQARMKYLVETRGIEWFRAEVRNRAPGVELAPVKDIKFETVEDNLGWHEQGDGKWFCAVYVAQGRVKDADGPRYRSAFREIAQSLGVSFVITPNTNLIIADIAPEQRAAVVAILATHGIPFPAGMTATRKVAHACVALPTCGLSLSESERVFGGVLDGIDTILRELKLENEPILIRMTGCPNGCARPYNADIGFVGRAPGKYAMFVGGSIRGDRLAGLEKKVIALADIPNEVRHLLEDFAKNRHSGERFTDFWGRTRVNGAAPTPEQFHVEFTERAAKKAAQDSEEPAPQPAAPAPEPALSAQDSSLVSAFSNLRGLQRETHTQDGLVFRQRLEIHLPATTDVAVYNAIFKSLREHFGD